jgi:16S rRNA (cytidine1402-2'-O)-methyltransferase
MAGSLVLVPTPLGNLGDVTLRALERLRALDGLVCEDTRRTRKLLEAHGIQLPLTSMPAFSERSRAKGILDRIEGGETLGLATDAGSIGVSDPGQLLVRLAIERGIAVEALPGPSAVLLALQLGGLTYDRFFFFGFLPRAGSARSGALRQLADAARLDAAIVLFESPRRLQPTLGDLQAALGDRRAVVARELTKLHEEVARGRLSELAVRFSGAVKGEVTIVLEGGAAPPRLEAATPDLDSHIASLLGEGLHTREIAVRIAKPNGLSAKEAYRRVLGVVARAKGTVAALKT